MGQVLEQVGRRCEAVDALGREYGADPALDREIEAWRDSIEPSDFTPRAQWSGVLVGPVGLQLHLDCRSVITPPMAVTFRRILAEELERSGFDDVHVIVTPDDDLLEADDSQA
jgi:hypothetical protein